MCASEKWRFVCPLPFALPAPPPPNAGTPAAASTVCKTGLKASRAVLPGILTVSIIHAGSKYSTRTQGVEGLAHGPKGFQCTQPRFGSPGSPGTAPWPNFAARTPSTAATPPAVAALLGFARGACATATGVQGGVLVQSTSSTLLSALLCAPRTAWIVSA